MSGAKLIGMGSFTPTNALAMVRPCFAKASAVLSGMASTLSLKCWPVLGIGWAYIRPNSLTHSLVSTLWVLSAITSPVTGLTSRLM